MLISVAHAAAESAGAAGAAGPATGDAFMMNMLLIIIMVVLFYVLMIMPQQKRFKRHKEMLDALQKGDEVITAGGFVGTIDEIKEGEDEIVLDLGNNVKVTALRSTIQSKKGDDNAPLKPEEKKKDAA